eukprot:scaffold40703_cov38-Phaeocystis_antarctica.AAC.1
MEEIVFEDGAPSPSRRSYSRTARTAISNHLASRALVTTHCPLPTAHCPLPTAYCPLPMPTAHSTLLLPTAHCLLPTAYRRVRRLDGRAGRRPLPPQERRGDVT